MPNSIAVGDVCTMIDRGVAGDQQIVNVWGGRFKDPLPDQTDYPSDGAVMASVCSVFRTHFRLNIVPSISTQCTFQEYTANLIQFPQLPPLQNSWKYDAVASLPGFELADTGSSGPDDECTFCTYSVRLLTAHPGRNGRGGKHIGPYTEGGDNFNTIEEVTRVAVQDAVQNMIDDIEFDLAGLLPSGFGFDVAVLSHKLWLGGISAEVGFPVTGVTCNRFVGSQLSRKSYLRGH